MTDFIKSNGGLLVVGAVVLGILGGFGKWQVSVEVAAQLANAGIVPASTVTAIDTRVGALEVIHDKDITRVEKKAERIAEILMED